MKIIYYVNPEKRPDGTFRCVVCSGIFDTWERARRHAQADHRKRKQIREAAAALEKPRRRTTKKKGN